jgi:hypothetical protein
MAHSIHASPKSFDRPEAYASIMLGPRPGFTRHARRRLSFAAPGKTTPVRASGPKPNAIPDNAKNGIKSTCRRLII